MSGQGKKRVLIIDDDAAVRVVLQEALRYASFEVEVASGGAQGLEIAATYTPDLVLLDVNMPEMNGFDVLRRLKLNESTRQIPVIFLTGNVLEVDTVVAALELDPADYITKTVSPKELIARIRWVLRHLPSGNASSSDEITRKADGQSPTDST